MTLKRPNESWALELDKVRAIHTELEMYFKRKGDLDALLKLREVFAAPRRCVYVHDVSAHVECELCLLDESGVGDVITIVPRG